MGLNTIHDYSEDTMTAFNVTKKCNIRGEFIDAVEYTRVEGIRGLPTTKFSAVIRCNGWADVSEGDRIKTPYNNRTYVVVRLRDVKDNKLQFRKRKDISNFTGTCDIFLE
jgi:hypothetical protein